MEVRPRIAHPGGATQATTKAGVGVCLHDGDAGIDLARGALAFDVAAPVVAAKAEREAAVAVEAERLGSGHAGYEDKEWLLGWLEKYA